MRIGELARRTGVSARSLRYYEAQRLLSSRRTAGGHRDFTESAVDRVIRIQEMFAAGLSSSTIAQLLPCINDEDGSPASTATPFLTDTLAKERRRLDDGIREMIRARCVLDGVIEAAEG